MENQLKHFGILGMHWGQRKSRNLTPSSQHVTRKGGVPAIETRRFGDNKVIRRRVVTEEQAKAFVQKMKNKKMDEEFRKAETTRKIILAGSALVTAYSVVSIASMLMSFSKPVPAVDAAYAEWLKNG
jgi:hypothetical protein